jgi:hypothetical protein
LVDRKLEAGWRVESVSGPAAIADLIKARRHIGGWLGEPGFWGKCRARWSGYRGEPMAESRVYCLTGCAGMAIKFRTPDFPTLPTTTQKYDAASAKDDAFQALP